MKHDLVTRIRQTLLQVSCDIASHDIAEVKNLV
jgi:hypothetical protein